MNSIRVRLKLKKKRQQIFNGIFDKFYKLFKSKRRNKYRRNC